MTMRGGPHCVAMANLSGMLRDWHRAQPRPRGRLYAVTRGSGSAAIPTPSSAPTSLTSTPSRRPAISGKARFIDEPPVLAVEIESPSDTTEDIAEKVREYLDAGVALVWAVNPFFQTVTVYRPDARPELFNDAQELTAEPHLRDSGTGGRNLRGLRLM